MKKYFLLTNAEYRIYIASFVAYYKEECNGSYYIRILFNTGKWIDIGYCEYKDDCESDYNEHNEYFEKIQKGVQENLI